MREGFFFLDRMRNEWENNSNTFDKMGEVAYVILKEEVPIGVVGLNIDPYKKNPMIGRIRHLYISNAHRNTGLGRKLLTKIINHGSKHFKILNLKTSNRVAIQLYRSLGFQIDHLHTDSNNTAMYVLLS